MPVRLLDPNADAKADWTEVPVGAAWAVLDEGTRQPSTPDTSDYISSATNGQISRQDCGTFTLASGETITSLKAWFYCETGATGTIVLSLQGYTGSPTTTVPAGSSPAWFSVTDTSHPLNQSQLDAIQAQAQTVTTGSTRKVHAAYIEVQTSLVYNDSGSGAISLSGGGADGKSGSDLGGGSVTASGSGSGQRVASDVGSGGLTASGEATEGRQFTDSPLGTVSLGGSASDSRSSSDSLGGAIGVSGLASEGSERADAVTGVVSLAGTAAEAAICSQSATGTIVLGGLGSESYEVANEHNDSRGGTILLEGVGSEAVSRSSSTSGQVGLSGLRVEDLSRTSLQLGQISIGGSGVSTGLLGFLDPNGADAAALDVEAAVVGIDGKAGESNPTAAAASAITEPLQEESGLIE